MSRSRFLFVSRFVIGTLLLLSGIAITFAQTSGFTYQGRLTDGGTAANGNYDLQFALFDSLSGGTQIGSAQSLNSVLVSAGVFNVTLDFGANSFSGANRFLEISARLSGAGSFTLLTPRQQVTSTPYAVRSVNASSADSATNATQLGGIAASNYVQTSDTRLSDSRPPTPNSSNYIQTNPSSAQNANFNVSGNGSAAGTLSGSIVNATTRYSLGGNGILSNAGTNNLFAGVGSGQGNTAGSNNAFFGAGAGSKNATGGSNTIIGASANVVFNNLTNATAIGANAQVDTSNSLVLGSISGVNGASANTNVGIGTTSPVFKLHVVDPGSAGLRVQTNTAGGTVASFGANGDFQIDAVNVPGGRLTVKQNGLVGVNIDPTLGRVHIATKGGQTGLYVDATATGFFSGNGVVGIGGGIQSFGGSPHGGVVGVGAPTAIVAQLPDAGTSQDTFTFIEGWVGPLFDATAVRKFHITVQGTYVAGSDFAEAMPGRGAREAYEPGDVLVINSQSTFKVEKSSKRNDVRLAGVYSTRPGMLGAEKNGTSRIDPDELPVAIVGIVPTKVSTENGPIQVGDLLTTSSTPGYAMKALPMRVGRAPVYRTGTILGKALEPLREGKGVIKVLVTLR